MRRVEFVRPEGDAALSAARNRAPLAMATSAGCGGGGGTGGTAAAQRPENDAWSYACAARAGVLSNTF
eukprot:248009-Chlamydomonas_euryale.AAC.1